MGKRAKKTEAQTLIAAIRSNVDAMYAGCDFDVFRANQRSLWIAVREAGVEQAVLRHLRADSR